MTANFEKPLRTSDHCRFYSYKTGFGDDAGPKCAAGFDLSGLASGKQCMPRSTEPCRYRQEYTDEERAAWLAWRSEREERMTKAMAALPQPIPKNSSGLVKCPNCGGRIVWSRERKSVHFVCSTDLCCGAHMTMGD